EDGVERDPDRLAPRARAGEARLPSTRDAHVGLVLAEPDVVKVVVADERLGRRKPERQVGDEAREPVPHARGEYELVAALVDHRVERDVEEGAHAVRDG